MSSVFLYGMIPVLAWGASDYFTGKSSKLFTPLTALFSISGVGLLVALLMMPLVEQTGIFSYPGEALAVMAIATLMTIAYLALTTALEIGPISVASTTANGYPLVTTLLTVALGASLVTNVLWGALIVFIGGALLSAEAKGQGLSFFKARAFRVATISVVSWGIAFYLLGRNVDQLSWAEVNLIVNAVMLFQCGVIMLARKVSIRSTVSQLRQKQSWPMWLAGALQSIGLAGFFVAEGVSSSVVVPAVMASASPLVTTVLAAYFDKEKLLRVNVVGAVIIVIGIMLINSVEL